jgi:predicted Zn finger-like uncharacterized protein
VIVTCEECSTSFQLDEARIPATGAQVRCSRCKHAFFLANPSASQADQVHSVAEEAASAPDGLVPEATSDLGAASADRLSETSSQASAPEPEADLDEDDWEFTEQIRVEGDDELGEEFGDDLTDELDVDLDVESDFGENEDFGAGFEESALDLETSSPAVDRGAESDPEIAVNVEENPAPASGLELEAKPETAEPQRDESSFGSVDDFSELMEDEEPAVAVDLASEIASELEQEAAAEIAASTVLERGPTDDLGDPESWDLVGGDDFASSSASLGTGAGSASIASAMGSVDAEEFFSEDAFGDSAYDEDFGSPSAFAGHLLQLGRLVGWATSVALVGAVLMLALQAEWSRWAQAAQVVNNGPLRAETISSGWVESSRVGAILRFEGQIRNTGAEAIWPGSVQLALLDSTGERLSVPPILAGAPLSEMTLREAAPQAFEASTAEALRRLGGTPLAPGEVRTFEALMLEGQLPEQAQRVLLEVGESRIRSTRVQPTTIPVADVSSAGEPTGVLSDVGSGDSSGVVSAP